MAGARRACGLSDDPQRPLATLFGSETPGRRFVLRDPVIGGSSALVQYRLGHRFENKIDADRQQNHSVSLSLSSSRAQRLRRSHISPPHLAGCARLQ